MRNIRLIFALMCIGSLVLTSCGSKRFKGYEKTETGLYYKFFVKNDSGKKAAEGDYLFMTISYRSTTDSIPAFETREMEDVLRPSIFKGDLYEAYSLLHEGDSAEFIIRADSFFLTMGMAQLPAFITDTTLLYFTIKLNKVKTLEDFAAEEVATIAEYVVANGITVEPTESGLYYIETQAGKGKQVQENDSLQVHYTGKFPNGEIFDSSVERGEPAKFTVQQLIPGFKEGLTMMKEGGKATLIIPSSIAYGEGIPGSPIGPFQPLIFEIEVIKIL
ncbi:MAG: FKBP-type peptidyl-prolyl cis-trans isomerase [Bacteroidales bacterium]|jgi:hypothetical protein|nr:FKBP-type peptidyl-prolyl cis-trans isomerase [Bacteroidales bacterium]